MVGPSAKRALVSYLKDKYEASLSLICRTVGLARSSCYYRTQRDDSVVEDKLRSYARRMPTRGFDEYYGRIRQEGLLWNRKRVLRVYRKLGLVKRRAVKRRPPSRDPQPLQEPTQLNDTYSMDFMSDSLEDGRKLRVLNVIDDYNREALCCEGSLSYPSGRVIRTLDLIAEERGCYPKRIRVDNGPEFTSAAFTDWAVAHRIELLHIQPGKPTQNAYIERFNRHFREDVLDAYLFDSYEQFNIIADRFRHDYNTYHPHAGNGGLPPKVFADPCDQDLVRSVESSKAKMNAPPLRAGAALHDRIPDQGELSTGSKHPEIV